MYKSIFVPLDGSEFSARSLPVAAALARRTGAMLHLASVFDPTMFVHFKPGDVGTPTFDPTTVDRYCERAKGWVEEQAASISNTGVPAAGVLLEGTVVEALAERAQQIQADLVVMTTHGRSGVERLWLGSVASSFLARSPAPVFLVRPSGADAPTAGHELPTGTLLVPVDGSPFSEAFLPHARTFASALGLAIELVMVVIPLSVPMSLFGVDALSYDDTAMSGQEDAAKAYLNKLAKTVDPTPTATVLLEASPARALIDYARESNSAAIAMATHGRSGVAHMMLGSVADKLLRGAEQPLLVYQPGEIS